MTSHRNMDMAAASPSRGRTDGQSGMALVLVLGVLASALLMVAHMMTVSELLAKEAKTCVLRSEFKYQAESATDVAFWMHLTDRRLFSDRRMGETLDTRETYSDFEPWMLDRQSHSFDDGRCMVYLNAADQGFRVDKPESLMDLVDMDDTETKEMIEEFQDVLKDYTDGDDLKSLYGMEKDDYEAEGFPTLPRNHDIQFREEVYWLPNWQDCIVGAVAIVPPRSMSFSSTDSEGEKPSFFSSSDDYIQTLLDLSDSEMEQVRLAKEAWEQDGVSLSESLDADLWYEISNKFSFQESNEATISAMVSNPDGVRLYFRVTRTVDASSDNFYSDQSHEALAVWERKYE